MAALFKQLKGNLEERLENAFKASEESSHASVTGKHQPGPAADRVDTNHPFSSFAAPSTGNAKWYVDGASYFWAVSMALEEARESIYILDWWLSPELYLRRPPAGNERYRLDNMLRAAAERGVDVRVVVYKEVPEVLSLNSELALEALHPNIKVFRHPDHGLSGEDVQAGIQAGFRNLSLRTFDVAKFPEDALKALYGTSKDAVLFWAHHEKLCLVDGKLAFMGGLDLCFGRWDTNSHSIADVQPGDVDAVVFPGQDYNNARIYDFEDVQRWENNKLDRTKSSRMGWSDLSISLSGPIVNDLARHFTDRWNYIYDQKYVSRLGNKYAPLHTAVSQIQQPPDGLLANIQLTRSASTWSSGLATEHSIANAYIAAIAGAEHFVYIENQFFITATDTETQHPVTNQIGRAIVDRVLRAHRAGEKFRVIVVIPAVPGFPGDLKSDGSLGTRAIMEYQYNSICRGGSSILEQLRVDGVVAPERYVGFWNLRNFDRINTSKTMEGAEREAGVRYEDARREFDARVEQGADAYPAGEEVEDDSYARYQSAARRQPDLTRDSVTACYMLDGPDIRSVPWNGSPEAEMDAFVSEQLYIHTKVLIADDRLVICGSANLNDRSQLGSHDSEIAVRIEDPDPVDSVMDGMPYTASRFAASLRRQLFRKHLGLLPHQGINVVAGNWTPVTVEGNEYDWGSEADAKVVDPLSEEFEALWRETARTNTDVFAKVFHAVPDNRVRSWEDYEQFFARHFIAPGTEKEEEQRLKAEGKTDYGHVVREEFPGGVAEVKEWLARIRGNLVEMPLDFLADVPDLAKQGLTFNSLTDEIYT